MEVKDGVSKIKTTKFSKKTKLRNNVLFNKEDNVIISKNAKGFNGLTKIKNILKQRRMIRIDSKQSNDSAENNATMNNRVNIKSRKSMFVNRRIEIKSFVINC